MSQRFYILSVGTNEIIGTPQNRAARKADLKRIRESIAKDRAAGLIVSYSYTSATSGPAVKPFRLRKTKRRK